MGTDHQTGEVPTQAVDEIVSVVEVYEDGVAVVISLNLSRLQAAAQNPGDRGFKKPEDVQALRAFVGRIESGLLADESEDEEDSEDEDEAFDGYAEGLQAFWQLGESLTSQFNVRLGEIYRFAGNVKFYCEF